MVAAIFKYACTIAARLVSNSSKEAYVESQMVQGRVIVRRMDRLCCMTTGVVFYPICLPISSFQFNLSNFLEIGWPMRIEMVFNK